MCCKKKIFVDECVKCKEKPCLCVVSGMMDDFVFVEIISDVVMGNDVEMKVLWLVG